MPKPNLAPIYERLNNAPTYHPMTAETFADWSMEAGDLITVSRDGNAYTSPVSTSRMVWKGSQQISIDSTGSKEREAISRISRRKYGRGGGSLTNNNYIYHEITDDSGLLKTTIQATESIIRTEVSNSYAGLSSTIEQTASSLRSLIISSKSSTIYPQYNDPNNGTRVIKEGDMWIKTNSIRKWEDFFNGDVSWGEGSQWDWKEMRGALVYTWKNGKWELVNDEQTVATLTDIDQTNEHIALVARSIDTLDGKMRANEAKFEVKANQIESTVADRTNALDSKITQTATQIRSEVNAVEQGLQSSITQTASSIRSEVNNSYKGLSSSITQTASSIRSEVKNSANGLASRITQTASSIRSEVSNSVAGLNSSITQTASSIRSEVNANYKGLSSSITQTASSIRSEVSNSVKGLSSSITQTASSIRAEVSNSYKGLSSSITQTASSIRMEVSNSVSGLNSYIQTQAGRIDLVVEGSGVNAKIKPAQIVEAINDGASSIIISASHVNLDGLVKATDLTAEYFKGKIASISNMDIKSATVTGSLYVRNGSGNSQNVSGAIWDLWLYQSGNTYTLRRKRISDSEWVDVGSFSRATSLSGSWSGNTYTVTASPQGNQISTSVGSRFYVASGSYYIAATRTDASGNTIDMAVKTYKLGVSGTTVQIQNSNGTQYSGTPTYSVAVSSVRNFAAPSGTSISDVSWTNNSSGYHIISEGDNGSAGIIVGTAIKVNGGTEQNKYNYLESAPTNLYRYAYAKGKAAGLVVSSWSVGAASGKVQVTANPQHATKSVPVSISGSNSITSNGEYYYKVYYENADGDDVEVPDTSKKVTVTIPQPSYLAVYDEDSSGNPVKVTSINIRSSKTLWAAYYIGNSITWGTGVTITPNYTDKGSGWYCTITTDSSGNKTCRLSRTFGVSQSVPFSNKSSYHLYT